MNSSVVVSQYPCIYHPGLTVLLKVILEITTYILDFLKSHINWYFHSLPGQCKDLRSVQFQLSTLDLYAIIFLVLILFIFWIHKPLLLLLYYQYSVASIIIIFLVLHFFVHLYSSIWYHFSFAQGTPFNDFFSAELLVTNSLNFVWKYLCFIFILEGLFFASYKVVSRHFLPRSWRCNSIVFLLLLLLLKPAVWIFSSVLSKSLIFLQLCLMG